MQAFDEVIRTIAFAGSEPVLGKIVPHLRELLESDQAVAYRFRWNGTSQELDFMFGEGLGQQARIRRLTSEFLERSAGVVTAYEPRPAPDERNSVLLLETSRAKERQAQSPIVRELFPLVGLQGQDQIRTLLCDGADLLAWVGAFRLAPFGSRDAEKLQMIIEPLVQRLRLEKALGRLAAKASALDVALDTLGVPAFILDTRGDAVHVNRAGRTLPREERDELIERGRRQQAGSEPKDNACSLLPIDASGIPTHTLVVCRRRRSLDTKLAAFKERWSLTQRQGEVLRQLLEGKSNKAIADRFGIREGTVELHITGLFRKVGVESRSELVSTFWSK